MPRDILPKGSTTLTIWLIIRKWQTNLQSTCPVNISIKVPLCTKSFMTPKLLFISIFAACLLQMVGLFPHKRVNMGMGSKTHPHVYANQYVLQYNHDHQTYRLLEQIAAKDTVILWF